MFWWWEQRGGETGDKIRCEWIGHISTMQRNSLDMHMKSPVVDQERRMQLYQFLTVLGASDKVVSCRAIHLSNLVLAVHGWRVRREICGSGSRLRIGIDINSISMSVFFWGPQPRTRKTSLLQLSISRSRSILGSSDVGLPLSDVHVRCKDARPSGESRPQRTVGSCAAARHSRVSGRHFPHDWTR